MRRTRVLREITELFRTHPVVVLVGPRQSGKTTVARQLAGEPRFRRGPVTRFDLEDPLDLARLDNPRFALAGLDGLVIIDEVQRRPDLFDILRVLVDEGKKNRRFLVLGSASTDLLRQRGESLAGRAATHELTPFSANEVTGLDRLWLRGGYPRAWLARSDSDAFTWLDQYINTFLERDIPGLGLRIEPVALRRFWMMLAHVHGQVLNQSELGRAFGATHKTVGHYVDILSSTFMVRQLQPWFANISSRQVKSPKVYFRDSGLLHALLGVSGRDDLLTRPQVGASWEGFALETVTRELGLPSSRCFFWSTHGAAELDLYVEVRGRPYGFEFKRTDSPRPTASTRAALAALTLERVFIVSPGDHHFPLDGRTSALGLGAVSTTLRALVGLSPPSRPRRRG